MEEQMPSSKKSLPLILATVVVVIGAVIAYASGLFSTTPAKEADSNTNTDTQAQNPNTQTPATEVTKKYNDGVYTKQVTYSSPGGAEKFDLSVSIKNNLISSVSVTHVSGSPVGKTLQTKFNQDISSLVVGKSIDEVSISVVSGASLTSKAFTSALLEIQAQAKVS